MRIPNLQILNENDRVELALTELRRHKTKGIIVRSGSGDFDLYTNQDILRAWSDYKVHLSELRGGLKLDSEIVRNFLVGRRASDFKLSRNFRSEMAYSDRIQIEQMFARINAAPRICACNGKSRHLEQSPPAREGGQCQYCSEGKYECC